MTGVGTWAVLRGKAIALTFDVHNKYSRQHGLVSKLRYKG